MYLPRGLLGLLGRSVSCGLLSRRFIRDIRVLVAEIIVLHVFQETSGGPDCPGGFSRMGLVRFRAIYPTTAREAISVGLIYEEYCKA